jgi:septum formation protein
MWNITLASASPRRKELLIQAGFSPEIVPSSVEEKITGRAPSETAEELSRIKCLDVAQKKRSAGQRSVVLGSDTIVVLDDRILGKPKDREDACKMLRQLQERKHQVITGVTIALVEGGSILETDTFSSRTDVWVAPMSEEEILSYVETGDPMDKAGAYGIQGPFARFVEKIEGDYYTVVGLPVAAVYRHLKHFL